MSFAKEKRPLLLVSEDIDHIFYEELPDFDSVFNEWLNSLQGKEDKLYFELTNLIFRSCGFSITIPNDKIDAKNSQLVIDYINENLKPTFVSGLELPLFFETNVHNFFFQVFIAKWDFFCKNGDFDGYFPKLFIELSVKNKIRSVRKMSIHLSLKLVAAFFRSIRSESFSIFRTKLEEYAEKALKIANKDTSHCIRYEGLDALQQLIMFTSSKFIRNKFLRYVYAGLCDESSAVVNKALDITNIVLNETSVHHLLLQFAQKVAKVTYVLYCIPSQTLSYKLIRCFTLLSHFENTLNEELVDMVFEQMYSDDRELAEMAGCFFIDLKLKFEAAPIVNLRVICEYIKDNNLHKYELIIDAIRSKFKLLSEWKLLGNIVIDSDDQYGVRLEERFHFLVILIFSVTSFMKSNRSNNSNQSNPRRSDTCILTIELSPLIINMLNASYSPSDTERCETLLLLLFSYFDLRFVKFDVQKEIMRTCRKKCFNPVKMDVSCSTLTRLMNDAPNRSIRELSRITFLEICNEFNNDFYTFCVEHKNSHFESFDNQRVHVLTFSAACLANYGHQLPAETAKLGLQLLKSIPVKNKATLSFFEALVTIQMTNVKNEIKKLSERLDILNDFSFALEDELENTHNFLSTVSNRFCAEYRGRFGYFIFKTITNILELLHDIFPISKRWKKIFSNELLERITAYVLATITRHKYLYDTNDDTRKIIIRDYLRIIEYDVLPLAYASLFVTNYSDYMSLLKKEVVNFFDKILIVENEEKVATWLFNVLKLKFEEIEPPSPLDPCIRLANTLNIILSPVKVKAQSMLVHLFINGIKYTTHQIPSTSKYTYGKNNFFLVLIRLKNLIGPECKKTIYQFIYEEDIVVSMNEYKYFMELFEEDSVLDQTVTNEETTFKEQKLESSVGNEQPEHYFRSSTNSFTEESLSQKDNSSSEEVVASISDRFSDLSSIEAVMGDSNEIGSGSQMEI